MIYNITFSQKKLNIFIKEYLQNVKHSNYYAHVFGDQITIRAKDSFASYTPAQFIYKNDYTSDFFRWFIENKILSEQTKTSNEVKLKAAVYPSDEQGNLKVVVEFLDDKQIDSELLEKINRTAK